ncbi:MAG: hypothetical protein HY587_08350 [Candidatus Omnitrophica bacterium]|nr:hypothetical protein [Candidatus Omnitrophota bacterium]
MFDKISENLWYKLGALFLALLVWNYVSHQELREIVRRIPLEIEMGNPNLTIIGERVKKLIVTFAVPERSIENFSESDIRGFHHIKLDRAVEKYIFRVSPNDIKRPKGSYRIKNIKPAEITVYIDELGTFKLPVQASIHGEAAAGYRVVTEEIKLDPEEVVMVGPIKKLGLLSQVLTEPIDVVGRTKSFRKKVKIRQYVDIRPSSDIEIEAFISITEQFASKEFENVPVHILGPPFEVIIAEVDPALLSVKVTGPTRILDHLEIKDLLFYVDVTGLKRGDHEIPYGFRLPQEIVIQSQLPLAKVKLGEVKIK